MKIMLIIIVNDYYTQGPDIPIYIYTYQLPSSALYAYFIRIIPSSVGKKWKRQKNHRVGDSFPHIIVIIAM